jgi:hypothetical protein
MLKKEFKSGEIQIFGSDSRKSKEHSCRNYKQIRFGECLTSCNSEYFVFLSPMGRGEFKYP